MVPLSVSRVRQTSLHQAPSRARLHGAMTLLSNLYKCLRLRLQAEELLPLEERAPGEPDDVRRRARMPHLLSEEESPPGCAAGEKNGEDDMHTWMTDEDERRKRLFRLNDAPNPPASPRRRPDRSLPCTPGANVSFNLAQRYTKSVYCCGACGMCCQPALSAIPWPSAAVPARQE